MTAQLTLTLYHCTPSGMAEQILRNGFQDTPYDAIDECGHCVGVWLCNHSNKHWRGAQDVVLSVELPAEVTARGWHVPCLTDPSGAVDWLIPAVELNRLSIRLI